MATRNAIGGAELELGRALQQEMDWLAAVIGSRIELHFGQPSSVSDVLAISPPEVRSGSRYARLIRDCGAGWQERILLALALAPHVAPQVLDVFFLRNKHTDRGYTEFGGVRGAQAAGFLPTGDTALFLLAGADVVGRLAAMRLLSPEAPLFAQGVLQMCPALDGQPISAGTLTFSPMALHELLTGAPHDFRATGSRLAQRLTTALSWDDLVLDQTTLDSLDSIMTWARHGRELLEDWGLRRHVEPGYRAVFHGGPGTGKTLAAALLGKALGQDVYRIDLSLVVSKYIGETEKELARLFTMAEQRHWILFFDEADALFGKRTQIQDSHDRFSNQEIAYLRQRVEAHPGIVIFAANRRVERAGGFGRHVQSTIYFPPPNEEQRLRLWRNVLSAAGNLGSDVDLVQIAKEYEVTGGDIVNIVRGACLQTVRRSEAQLSRARLIAELKEHGKVARGRASKRQAPTAKLERVRKQP